MSWREWLARVQAGGVGVLTWGPMAPPLAAVRDSVGRGVGRGWGGWWWDVGVFVFSSSSSESPLGSPSSSSLGFSLALSLASSSALAIDGMLVLVVALGVKTPSLGSTSSREGERRWATHLGWVSPPLPCRFTCWGGQSVGELAGRGRVTHLGSHPIPLGFFMFIGAGAGVLIVVANQEG